MTGKHVCPVCVIQILHLDKSIQCEDKCGRFFHADCVKLSNTEYSKLVNPRTNDKSKWICRRDDCAKDVIQQHSQDSILNEILKKLNSVATKSDLDVLSSKLTNLTTEVANINQALSTMEPRLSAVENELASVKNELKEIQDHKAAAPSVELVVEEIADRERRSRNIIIYNLPENKNKTVSVRVKHDNDLVTLLVGAFCTSNHENDFKTFRIGRPHGDRPRPLRVIFKRSDSVLDFSRNFDSSSLKNIDDRFTGINYSRDRTPAERKHLEDLRSSLKRRTDSGEPDLTIRFVNGIPKIVKKAPKNDQISDLPPTAKY